MDLKDLAKSLASSTRLSRAEKELMEKFRGPSPTPPDSPERALAWPAGVVSSC